jgi:hypothetical protein
MQQPSIPTIAAERKKCVVRGEEKEEKVEAAACQPPVYTDDLVLVCSELEALHRGYGAALRTRAA